MAFVKREIKDRVVQYPRRYQLVEVQPGIFDLIPVTGTVTEEGTPVNKELLQRYEDGLDAALEKTGDGKDVTVTFSEADTEAHIASGEKLSTMFGKILKKFKNVAPTSHASSANTYGVGTGSNYGHCKTINNLTRTSFVNGESLAAYQGKLLNDKVTELSDYVFVRTLSMVTSADNQSINIPSSDITGYSSFIFHLRGTISATSSFSSTRFFQFYLKGAASGYLLLYEKGLSSSSPLPETTLDIKSNPLKNHGNDTIVDIFSTLELSKASFDTNSPVFALSTNSIKVSGTVYLDIYRRK